MRKSIDIVNNMGQAVPDDVLESMHAVMHLARARHHAMLREGGHEMPPMEGKVLGFFARQPGATLKDLAEHSGRDKGQLAKLIQSLRERGLLEARADDADRRITRLYPTEPALALHQQVQGQRKQLADRAVAGMASGEHAALLALLERVRANLAQER